MKKVFAIVSLFITFAIVVAYILIAPEVDIIGENFFVLAGVGLLISLIFALLSKKGIWRKAAIGSLVFVIILFGIFILVIRFVISGP